MLHLSFITSVAIRALLELNLPVQAVVGTSNPRLYIVGIALVPRLLTPSLRVKVNPPLNPGLLGVISDPRL